MIKKQIMSFMEGNVELIAGFVGSVMSYDFEDTGHSIKFSCKMGNKETFSYEIEDSVARNYVRRLLAGDDGK